MISHAVPKDFFKMIIHLPLRDILNHLLVDTCLYGSLPPFPGNDKGSVCCVESIFEAVLSIHNAMKEAPS